MKAHYYRLDGESLEALDQLVAWDRRRNDERMKPFMAALDKAMGKAPRLPDASSEPGVPELSARQLKTYQRTLGFLNPPVTVQNYDGVLYRAYHTYPKLAMNPGTSKRNFGLIDMFNDPARDAQRKRVAIYTSYEDYKGRHFAPPGAIKMTDEEFASLDKYSDMFEYYRTYDEGVALPANFNPAKHQSTPQVMAQAGKSSHRFLVQGASLAAMRAVRDENHNWVMPAQDIRDKTMPQVFAALLQNPRDMWAYPRRRDGELQIELFTSARDWARYKDVLSEVFTVRGIEEKPLDGRSVFVVPRLDSQLGAMVAGDLAKLPPPPPVQPDWGFTVRPPLENSFRNDWAEDGMTGFPYMQIERQGGVSLLTFRLPSCVTAIDTPPDCVTVSLDDYKALGGVENAPGRQGWPTHLFRIEGVFAGDLEDYFGKLETYRPQRAQFVAQATATLEAMAPGFKLDECKLPDYKPYHGHMTLEVVMPEAMFQQAKTEIEKAFHISGHEGASNRGDMGAQRDRHKLEMVPRNDTPEGQAWSAQMQAVGYPPKFPWVQSKIFGFHLRENGYDLLDVLSLSQSKQEMLLFYLPDYIKTVETPQDCLRLTRKECALLLAEYADVAGRRLLPPRPAGMEHLPSPPEESQEASDSMRRAKDRDGLPLHERTEFSWFKIRNPQP